MRSDPTTDQRADVTPVLRSDLVDLSGVSLDELDKLPPNVLTSSLRRILAESARQPNSYGQDYAASI